MDTVHEENASDPETMEVPCSIHTNIPLPNDSLHPDGHAHSQTNSRRPSLILAALRRPSQSLALSAHSVLQRNLLVELAQKFKSHEEHHANERVKMRNDYNKRLGDDALTTALSALYAKLIVVLGIAFPITEIVSLKVPASFYQGFYLYLYSVSLIFILFMYIAFIREGSQQTDRQSLHENEKNYQLVSKKDSPKIVRYGSFYLRLGAVAFGIGSMVYSGLEFGQYFELKEDSKCSNVLLALTPAARMILTLVQMQFIFVNSKEMEMNRHIMVARFGMMHMIATNLCEWLYVLVEETKHEILHLQHHSDVAATNLTNITQHHMTKRSVSSENDMIECRRTNIMGSLVQNASPFLFPCTVEYSLICAVILFEMWKNIRVMKTSKTAEKCNKIPTVEQRSRSQSSMTHEKLMHQFSILFGGGGAAKNHRSHLHFSVDCAGAHRGLFTGILIIVVTIISLIMFFVLNKDPSLNRMAIYEVNVCELILYIITLLAVVIAMFQMRNLKYYNKKGGNTASLSLDTTLLVMAQTGVFIYCMFSIIGSYFTIEAHQGTGVLGLLAELFSLVQTVVQTMFVLSSWWRRCSSRAQIRKRPGRQVITFLLVANMALWTTNTLEKGRAEFRPTHLTFFGVWPWTVITHVSMPLVIFYRFHSTICLFEIWKNAYKIKSEHH